MKIIDYLNNEEIVSLYESIHTFESISSQWQLSASPILKLVLDLEKYGEGKSRYDKLFGLSIFNNLMDLKLSSGINEEDKLKIQDYLKNIPNFDESLEKQPDGVLDIHGYRTMLIIRYLRQINEDFIEFPIFEKEWIATKERKNELQFIYCKYLKKEILYIIEYLKDTAQDIITNFSILNFFFKDKSKISVLDLIYKLWFDSSNNSQEKYEKFQSLLKPIEKIIEKDSLLKELSINYINEKKPQKV